MAQADYFLELEGIPGESQDDKHKDKIEISSFSFGMTQAGTMSSLGGGGAGKVQVHDIAMTKTHDKASPKLMLACANGDHISKATIICRKAGKEQQEYLKITLTDVIVSSFQAAAMGGSDPMPQDHFALNFAKIESEYKEQKKDGTLGGSVKAGWDVKANKKV